MTTAAILLMTLTFLASMAVLTIYARKVTRKLNRVSISRDEWKAHSRTLARRATRAERLQAMAEDRAGELEEERDSLIRELGQVRADLTRTAADRDLAKEISTGLLQERDALMAEVELKRGRALEKVN